MLPEVAIKTVHRQLKYFHSRSHRTVGCRSVTRWTLVEVVIARKLHSACCLYSSISARSSRRRKIETRVDWLSGRLGKALSMNDSCSSAATKRVFVQPPTCACAPCIPMIHCRCCVLVLTYIPTRLSPLCVHMRLQTEIRSLREAYNRYVDYRSLLDLLCTKLLFTRS